MDIFSDPNVLMQWRSSLEQSGKRIAFVPTMGNLHDGHISLFKMAQEHADILMVSLFVNPLQFSINEDLDKYPRTLQADIDKLKAIGADCIFTPAMGLNWLPENKAFETLVHAPPVSKQHDGVSRPQFFTGVCTIVAKLFNVVAPHIAIFGKKDYQQYRVIQAMVRDLNYPIELMAGEIIRDPDGLAMSSRNSYLNEKERRNAPHLRHLMLEAAEVLITEGFQAWETMQTKMTNGLKERNFKIDYLSLCRADSLEIAKPGDTECVLLAAVWVGQQRLIDNIEITVTK